MSEALPTPALRSCWFWFAMISVIGGLIALAFLVTSVRKALDVPKWVLIAENQTDAVQVRMVTAESDEPVDEVLVVGGHLPTAPLRLSITNAEEPESGVTTLFVDHTYGPGRWVFMIDGVHIDCQPVRIVVNGAEHPVRAKVTVIPSEEPKYVPPRWY